eukprot:4725652-Pyramimonas_sp.AAC.1
MGADISTGRLSRTSGEKLFISSVVGNVEPLRPLAPWQPPLSRESFSGLAPVVVHMYRLGVLWLDGLCAARGGGSKYAPLRLRLN